MKVKVLTVAAAKICTFLSVRSVTLALARPDDRAGRSERWSSRPRGLKLKLTTDVPTVTQTGGEA